MDLLGYLRTQAHANRLANHRLHHAMRTLSREEFAAPRTSFFPSLAKTLNHILAVDLYGNMADWRALEDIAVLKALRTPGRPPGRCCSPSCRRRGSSSSRE